MNYMEWRYNTDGRLLLRTEYNQNVAIYTTIALQGYKQSSIPTFVPKCMQLSKLRSGEKYDLLIGRKPIFITDAVFVKVLREEMPHQLADEVYCLFKVGDDLLTIAQCMFIDLNSYLELPPATTFVDLFEV